MRKTIRHRRETGIFRKMCALFLCACIMTALCACGGGSAGSAGGTEAAGGNEAVAINFL